MDLIRHETRERRGGGTDHAPTGGSADSVPDVMAAVADAGPTPDVVAEVTEGCARLLGFLKADELRRVAVWKLEGYMNVEIGAKLGRSVAAVERKLASIRTIWEREARNHAQGDSPASRLLIPIART